MTSDAEWDVNKYWSPHEVPLFWEVKKKFLLSNKDKLPEDRLICMAQVYYNVKAMGCRYPKHIMDEVDKLAEGLDDDTSQWVRPLYEQNFVLASDAIRAKVLRLGNPIPKSSEPSQPGGSGQTYIPFVKSSDKYNSTQSFGPLRDSYIPSQSPKEQLEPTPNTFNKPAGEVIDLLEEEQEEEIVRPELANCKYLNDGKPSLPLPRSLEERRRQYVAKRKSTEPQGGSSTKMIKVTEGSQETSMKREGLGSEVIDLTDSPMGETSQGGRWSSWQPQKQQQPNLLEQQQKWQQQNSQQYGRRQSNNRLNIDPKEVMESGPFGRVVVFENFNGDSPHSVISRTASAARMETSFTFTREGGEVSCRMMLGGLFLASATAHSEKLAREAACRTAIERLKETSFTVQIKVPFVGGTSCIDRTFASSETGTDYRADLDVPIEEHNIGRKIMKLMGWTGGGLGKNQQGLEEPVRPNDVSVKRSGLGIKNARDFKQKVSNLLRDYCRGESKNDLVFSPEFTRDERKIIHELVQKYNLKSRSYGKGEDKRHIVVFKKINAQEIVEDLIKCGGETEKYILIPPSSA